jgi:membrane protein YdbS with pleckstrin-like domain
VTDPSIADGIEKPLDRRVIALDRTIGMVVTALLALPSFVFVVLVAAVGASGGRALPVLASLALLGGWAAAVVALGTFTYRWPAVVYRHASYRVDAQGIEIRRGVYWRRILNIPRSRVQHTDVSQGPVERKYGLGTLVIYTAGTDHARVALSGLDYATAVRIRQHLLPGEASDAV